ncbi:hypothetical protein GPECTOR_122g450 [Gonium pectorale]|uniref:FAST kinase leucine-rich domain-containing protein n=1 Tax=Gonium pectorale TaxID=33097 RepID=A0A150FYP8_GONPE|nr:hypothetical protein GPECTOR_122g450 [Gonium pectorale]|eukprot:KXZ42709.1 hypothetical protein GPECTOR_122g450 [Gonium pectorale]
MCASRGTADAEAFARSILGKTYKYAPAMEMQALSNTLWAMGKMGIKLPDLEPLRPHLVKVLEDRMRELMAREGLTESRSAEQLWYGLSHTRYGWDLDLLRSMVRQTVQDMAGWEDVKNVFTTCQSLTLLTKAYGIRISKDDRDRLTAILSDKVSTADETVLANNAGNVLTTAKVLALRLDVPTVKVLHDSGLAMPLLLACERGVIGLSGILYDSIKLGYHPAPAEAQLWCQRLLEDLPEKQRTTQDAQSWVFVALSSCRSLTPSPELKAQLKALAEALPNAIRAGTAIRTLQACRAWGVDLAPTTAKRLGRLAVV